MEITTSRFEQIGKPRKRFTKVEIKLSVKMKNSEEKSSIGELGESQSDLSKYRTPENWKYFKPRLLLFNLSDNRK